jgi:SHS2 domain-containing protein
MKDFEILDISGDIGIRSFGKDREVAFVHAALGMFSLITSLKKIKEEKTIVVTVESDSLDGLLVSWLNELIFHFDTYGFIGKNIAVKHLSDRKIITAVTGETFDPQRHERKLLIKAATYHKLSVEKANGVWEIHVIFDI